MKDQRHPSHVTRISVDASSYDEICVNCGETDQIGGWGDLAKPCPKSPSPSVDEVAERREALLTILRNAAIETAKRVSGRRGPYVFDEAELQGLASEIAATAASLVSPPKAGEVEPVAWRWRAKVKGEWGLWSTVEMDPNDWTWREYWEDLQVQPLYANHEARGDGVRVTDEMREAAFQVLWPEAEWDGEVGCRRAVNRALEAALPPLGDGRAEIVEAAAAIADVAADEQDVLALSADESNFAGYRQGERVAKEIAAAIRSLSQGAGHEQ